MPLRYIAGKMMVVRSLYAGLDLEVREPSGHPLAGGGDTPLRFAAMIPMQVYNTLRVPEERKRLERTDILIIGGGAIDAALEREIRKMPNRVYSTYGMTETLSHIALRRLNGPEASPYYHPFPSVTLSLSPDNTLVIDAPLVCDGRLVTNDVARLLPDGSFAILGRKDNIINSGGIKIQIEEVEERLRAGLGDESDFAVTAVPDEKFGEALTLLLASPVSAPRSRPNEARGLALVRPAVSPVSDSRSRPSETSGLALVRLAMSHASHPEVLKTISQLPKYQQPKHILRVAAIPRTGSGKIDRPACRKLAALLIADS